MNLRAMVAKYRELSGGEFGRAVPLASFGLARDEAERVFSALDEDYHISRFFHFTTQPAATTYRVNGFDHSHLSIDAEVETVL